MEFLQFAQKIQDIATEEAGVLNWEDKLLMRTESDTESTACESDSSAVTQPLNSIPQSSWHIRRQMMLESDIMVVLRHGLCESTALQIGYKIAAPAFMSHDVPLDSLQDPWHKIVVIPTGAAAGSESTDQGLLMTCGNVVQPAVLDKWFNDTQEAWTNTEKTPSIFLRQGFTESNEDDCKDIQDVYNLIAQYADKYGFDLLDCEDTGSSIPTAYHADNFKPCFEARTGMKHTADNFWSYRSEKLRRADYFLVVRTVSANPPMSRWVGSWHVKPFPRRNTCQRMVQTVGIA